MTKHFPAIALAVCIATFLLIWIPTADAKQRCRVAMPASPHGYWSWRLIDGRKCWYEGKPMLSKSLLEWPAQASAEPDSSKQLAPAVIEETSDQMESQAWAPSVADTFEALWRTRVERH
jgi:hypothetical protein